VFVPHASYVLRLPPNTFMTTDGPWCVGHKPSQPGWMMYRCVTRLFPWCAKTFTDCVISAEPHSVQVNPSASPGPNDAFAAPTPRSDTAIAATPGSAICFCGFFM